MVIKKKLIIFSIFYLTLVTSAVKADTYRCDNIRGTSTKFVKGQISAGKDGFSGTTITLNIDAKNKKYRATWSGRNKIDEKLIFLSFSQADGWASFIAIRQAVIRTYTLYHKQRPTVLGFTESQTQLLTGTPQIRSFFANCR